MSNTDSTSTEDGAPSPLINNDIQSQNSSSSFFSTDENLHRVHKNEHPEIMYCKEGPLNCLWHLHKAEPHPIAVLILTSCGAFLASVQNSALILAFPNLLESLHSSFVAVFWMLLAYMLVVAALVTFCGRMGDLVGKSVLFKVGVFLFALGALLCGVAVNTQWGGWDVVTWRIIMGIGGALMLGNAASLVTDAFMGPHLGIAMGVAGLVQAIGFAVGPLLGGALLKVSWRWIFLINVPVGGFIFIMCLLFLRDPAVTRAKQPKTAEERKAVITSFDWFGFVIMVFFLVTFLTALSEESFKSLSDAAIYSLWGMGALGCVAFIVVELLVANPMMKLSLFKIPTFTILNIAASLASLGAAQVVFAMIFFFQGPYGQDPLHAGISILPYGIAVAVAGIISGFLTDIIGIKLLTLLGFIFSGAGAVGFIYIKQHSSYGLLCILLIIVGVGQGLINAPSNKGTMASVAPQDRGTASATVVLLLSLFRMIALVLVFKCAFSGLPSNVLIAIFLQGGGAGITPDSIDIFMNGIYTCMWIAIGSWLAATVVAFFLKEDFWPSLNAFKQKREQEKLEAQKAQSDQVLSAITTETNTDTGTTNNNTSS